MSNFDEFFNNETEASDNFLTPTFETFAVEKAYQLVIGKAATSESKFGYQQLQLEVDAVSPAGTKEPMGRIWVPTQETVAGSETATAVENAKRKQAQKEFLNEDEKKVMMIHAMNGRSLYQFLRAIAPDKFAPYKLEKAGKKTIAVDGNGNELTKQQRADMDVALSNATVAFGKAAVHGAACKMIEGVSFWYKLVPRAKDPSRTNQVFLLESEIYD